VEEIERIIYLLQQNDNDPYLALKWRGLVLDEENRCITGSLTLLDLDFLKTFGIQIDEEGSIQLENQDFISRANFWKTSSGMARRDEPYETSIHGLDPGVARIVKTIEIKCGSNKTWISCDGHLDRHGYIGFTSKGYSSAAWLEAATEKFAELNPHAQLLLKLLWPHASLEEMETPTEFNFEQKWMTFQEFADFCYGFDIDWNKLMQESAEGETLAE
jgi:hypothetical protein